MRILVTGATGVLGRRVVPLLVAEGHDVTAVARGQADAVRAAGAAPIELDLLSTGAVTRAVDGHDVVVDLATRIPPAARMALPWAWRDNDRLRSEAAPLMARVAGRVGAHYVRESIGMLYAEGGDAWVAEDHPVAPVRNTRSALDAEAAAHGVTAAGGTGVVLRFARLYGPDSVHLREELATAEGGMAAVLGDLDGYVSQVHLDDAAAAVVAGLRAPAGTYNVVEDDPVRKREHVKLLAELVGRRLRTPPAAIGRIGPARVVARSVRMTNRALRVATGWAPVHASARDGFRDVALQVRGASRA